MPTSVLLGPRCNCQAKYHAHLSVHSISDTSSQDGAHGGAVAADGVLGPDDLRNQRLKLAARLLDGPRTVGEALPSQGSVLLGQEVCVCVRARACLGGLAFFVADPRAFTRYVRVGCSSHTCLMCSVVVKPCDFLARNGGVLSHSRPSSDPVVADAFVGVRIMLLASTIS